jgi:hypothetical protein
MLRLTGSRPVCLGVKPHLGPKTRFLLLSDSCGFVDVGLPFWREDSLLFTIAAVPLQRSHSRVRVPFETLPTWRARSLCLYPPEQGGAVIPPGTGFPFRRLLRFDQLLTCSPYNISTWTIYQTQFLYCSEIVAVETCFFVEPLLSNGCCIAAYLEVVA